MSPSLFGYNQSYSLVGRVERSSLLQSYSAHDGYSHYQPLTSRASGNRVMIVQQAVGILIEIIKLCLFPSVVVCAIEEFPLQ